MMMTGFREVFIDTNVLIFATNSVSPWHLVATESLQTMREADIELFVSPQVLREYLATATRLNVTGKVNNQLLLFILSIMKVNIEVNNLEEMTA